MYNDKHYNEMNFEEKSAIREFILRVEVQIRDTYSVCAERIIKALFIVNGGGVGIVLAYLHALKDSDTARVNLISKFSLLAFVVGLVFAFILVLIDYFILRHNPGDFHKKTKSFFSSKKI